MAEAGDVTPCLTAASSSVLLGLAQCLTCEQEALRPPFKRVLKDMESVTLGQPPVSPSERQGHPSFLLTS